MRTNEARWLKRSDVNLAEGVININQSKGADQHRVALHESMLRLLERYDENMAKVMPDRTCFIPNKNDCFHRPAWAEYHFHNATWKPGSITSYQFHIGASPESIKTYVDTDLEHLRECSLSIEDYPVAEKVFEL